MNLGDIMDKTLSFSEHINEMCMKASYAIRSIGRIRKYLPSDGLKMLVNPHGAPWVNKSIYPRKFGNHVTDRPTDRPSAPQAYQCLLSHFLVTLRAQEKADCTSMLSSIDSCQNRVSADQYHLTVWRAQVSTHQSQVFFEVIR